MVSTPALQQWKHSSFSSKTHIFDDTVQIKVEASTFPKTETYHVIVDKRAPKRLDCEQSLSFPSVSRAIERATCGEPRVTRARRNRFFPASPHSLLVSFPNLHNIN